MNMQPNAQASVWDQQWDAKSILRVPADSLSSDQVFQQYRRQGIPVVVTGLLKHRLDWNLDYLCSQLGDRSFPIRRYGWERYQQDKRHWTSLGSAVDKEMMPFSKYAELLRNGQAEQEDLYLGKCSLGQTSLANAPELMQVKRLGFDRPVTDWNLWVGMGGHTTCLHYDPMDGTLLQLYGSKRLILFPPSQLYQLYPFPLWVHLRHGLKLRASYSQVYPERPDFDTFPRLKEAFKHRYEVLLQPGDVLFIPACWWHEVIAVGTGVVCSANRFWAIRPPSRAIVSWSKWRVHLGSVLAAPHLIGGIMDSLKSDRRDVLQKLLQRL